MNNPATIYRSFWPVREDPTRILRPDIGHDQIKKAGLAITEKRNKVRVAVDMPGIPADKIKVHYHNGTLWLRGASEKKDENKTKDFSYEAYRTFTYRLRLPERVRQNKQPNIMYEDNEVMLDFEKIHAEALGYTPLPFTEE